MYSRLCLALAASAVTQCSHPPAGVPDAAPRLAPAPARPDDVLVTAHFAHPRATVHTLGVITGLGSLLELGFTSQLGVDPTVLAACDLTRPIDVVLTGTPESPSLVMVLTPGAMHDFRSTLAGRYRFATTPGVGDVLQPRDPVAPRAHRAAPMTCALVGVPGPVASRMVCGDGPAALEHAARWAAASASTLAADDADAVLDIDGATARTRLLPALHAMLDAGIEQLAERAASARRSHPDAPDFGDPETVVAMMREATARLDAQAADVHRARLRVTMAPEAVTVTGDAVLDAHGTGSIARDAVDRATAPTSHALAGRLAPDSMAALASHAGSPRERVAMATEAIDAALRVLGARVGDATAARADLVSLVAQSGAEAVAGLAREPGGGTEASLVLEQVDGGAGARAALLRIAHATWLHPSRPGTPVVTATLRPGGVLLLRMAPTPGRATPAATPPPSIALGVVGDVLAVALGTHPEATLAAIGLRAAASPPPAVLDATDAAPWTGAADLARGEAIDRAIVRGSYGAIREGDEVTGHARLVLTAGALTVVRALASHAMTPD